MLLGMPTYPYLYANDLNEVLKQKHASGTYKSLVSFFIFIFVVMQRIICI